MTGWFRKFVAATALATIAFALPTHSITIPAGLVPAGQVAHVSRVSQLLSFHSVAYADPIAAPNVQPARVFNVRNYGATGDGSTDDGPAIALAIADAIAYEAVYDTFVIVDFPTGVYVVHDASTADTGEGESYGGIVIPSTTESIILNGPSATIKIGSNGITTSAIRCFADNCIIQGFTIDPNGDAAPYGVIPPVTSADYETKDNSGIELNGCENSVIRDCMVLNGDKSISTYNTGTIVYDFTGGSSERLVTLSGGTWPAWVDTDAAITIAGVRYPIASVPSSTTLTLSANSSTASDVNPGSDVGSTSNWSVTCYATTSGGENHFLIVNGRRCRIEGCLSLDAAWAPFLVSGTTDTETLFEGTDQEEAGVPIMDNGNYITDCTAVNFKGNGIRINSGRSLFVRGCVMYSLRCDGRTALLADAGSSQGDLRTERLFIENSEFYCNPDGDFDGAASIFKIGSVYQVHVKNCKIEAGSKTNSVSVRLEDNVRSVFLEDCYIRPNIFFTPATATGSIFQGNLTAHASGTGGRVRYTVSGTPSSALFDNSPIQWGRELQVRGSGVDQYNGPQEIYAVGAGYIETERLYVAGTLGSGTYGQTGIGQLKMRNCVIDGIQAADSGITTVSHYGYFIQNCNAFDVDIEGCTFNQRDPLDVQYGGIFTDYLSENGWSMFRLVRNKFYFDTDKTCRILRGSNSDTTEFATSGRSIFHSNEKHNKDSGATYWTYETNAEREILFSSEGENPRAFRHSAYPASAHVTWAVGDIIYNTAPSSSSPLGWVCITAGSPGTWWPINQNNTLVSNITDEAYVATGEDDLITYSMPANTLGAVGDSLEIEAGFTFAANANSKTIKLYLGSTDLLGLAGAAQNSGSYYVRAVAVRDASNIAKVSVVGGTYGGSGTPLGNIPGNVFNHTADMTGILTIKGTGQATSNNDVVMQYLRVRKVPAP